MEAIVNYKPCESHTAQIKKIMEQQMSAPIYPHSGMQPLITMSFSLFIYSYSHCQVPLH